MINLDNLVVSEVPVAPQIIGKPAEGYVIEDISLEPGKIELKGPEAELKSLATVSTMPVDVSGRNRPFVQRVTLDLKKIKDRPIEERLIEVRVKILPLKAT